MFHKMINAVAGFGKAKVRNGVLIGASLACLPTAAFARHPDFRFGFIVPPPPVPVYVATDCAPARQWVEPVYQDVTEQVWVPAMTTTQMQRVDVPAEYGWRDVVVYDRFGRPHESRQQVLISPAQCENRAVQVIVCPGHYEQQTHQRLVCEGHWQETSAPVVVVRPAVHFGFSFPF